MPLATPARPSDSWQETHETVRSQLRSLVWTCRSQSVAIVGEASLTWKKASRGKSSATLATTSGSELNSSPNFCRPLSKIVLLTKATPIAKPNAVYSQRENRPSSVKGNLKGKRVKGRKEKEERTLAAHFASQPLPAPKRLPARTDVAMLSENGA